MANTRTNVKSINQEEVKMTKYIVEAPEPKKGQKISSGGIRENGKITAQYRNPVPYKEPSIPQTVSVPQRNSQLMIQEQKRARRNEFSNYLLGIAWQEFGEPLVRAGLNRLADKVISCFDVPRSLPSEAIPAKDIDVIDVEAEEISTSNNDDKIIRFPNRRVS